MSALDALNRPLSFGIRAPQPMKSPIVVGGVPRANLLPPSVVAERRLRHAARGVGAALIATLVVALLAVGASFVTAARAAADLAIERQRTAELIAGQGEFTEVRSVLSRIDELSAARAAVASTDVEWTPYLARIAALLPSGTSVSTVTVTAATPTTPLPTALGASGAPLAATLAYTVSGPDLQSVRDWMLGLRSLPGYSSATLRSVSDTQGLYSADVEIAVDTSIYSGRFATAETTTAATEDGAE